MYLNCQERNLSFHSLNRDLFSVVDIHAGLGRLAAYLVTLQRPPVVIVVIGRTANLADGRCVDVEHVGLVQRAVGGIADERVVP